MTASQGTGRPAGRRAWVAAAGAAGLTAALAACGSSDDGSEDTTQPAGEQEKPEEEEEGGSSGEAEGGGTLLAKAADIPEGGGKIFKEQKVVVTQPTAGDFKAFSATCTHQGCAVTEVTGGTIICPCHKSKFDVTDGSPTAGPAKQPLPAAKITVDGDSIMLG